MAGRDNRLGGTFLVETPAWRIHDGISNDNPGYNVSLTADDFRNMFLHGWELAFTVRASRNTQIVAWSVSLANDPGWGLSEDGSVQFDITKDDDLNEFIVTDPNRLSEKLTGQGGDFHTIRVVGAALSSQYEWFVDGKFLGIADISDGTPDEVARFDNVMTFQSGSGNADNRDVDWHSVTLEFAPSVDSLRPFELGDGRAAVLDEQLFFDNAEGLWQTDGTVTGTTRVLDELGQQIDDSQYVASTGEVIYLFNNGELWKIDDAAQAPTMVTARPGGGEFTNVTQLLALQDTSDRDVLYFISDGELWRYSESTDEVVQIESQDEQVIDSAAELTLVDIDGTPTLFFSAKDGLTRQLFFVDDAGDSLDEPARPATAGENPIRLTAADETGLLYFVVGDQLRTTKGSGFKVELELGAPPDQLTNVGGTVFLESGGRLFKHTSNDEVKPEGGAALLQDPTSLVNFGGQLFFAATLADPRVGTELWRYDSVAGKAVLVHDVFPQTGESSRPSNLTVIGDTLFFIADDGQRGRELWKSDGKRTGTEFVTDINVAGDAFGAAVDNQFIDVAGRLYFTADDGSGVPESLLWKTDGTAETTRSVFGDLNATIEVEILADEGDDRITPADATAETVSLAVPLSFTLDARSGVLEGIDVTGVLREFIAAGKTRMTVKITSPEDNIRWRIDRSLNDPSDPPAGQTALIVTARPDGVLVDVYDEQGGLRAEAASLVDMRDFDADTYLVRAYHPNFDDTGPDLPIEFEFNAPFAGQTRATYYDPDRDTIHGGDAPAPYPTLRADDGARHVASGPQFGATRGADGNGQPTSAADGDDWEGSDDEDGITFGSIRVGQLDASVIVNVQNAPDGAQLDAWIDFNGDGSWGGPGEQIFDGTSVNSGDNALEFDVPSWAISGTTYARFRLSTAGDLGMGGPAADGEVEDYQITIDPPAAATGVFGEQNTMPTAAPKATGVYAADVDGDGDMDVLSASFNDGRIAWYENDGNEFFTPHNISTSAALARSVFAVLSARLRFFEAREQFDSAGQFLPLFFTLISKVWSEAGRREATEPSAQSAAVGEFQVAEQLEDAAIWELLSPQLETITDEERQLIHLRFCENLSFVELGRRIGRSEQEARGDCYRLVNRLAKQIN